MRSETVDEASHARSGAWTARHSARMACAVLVAGMVGAALAHADVYTWEDGAGNVHSSNLAPPAGARVLHHTHEDPALNARALAAQAAARDAERASAHETEVQGLKARVAELERHAQAAPTIPAPARIPYAAAPAPPVVVAVAPSQPTDVAPLPGWDCAWGGCGWPVIVNALPAIGPHARASRRSHHGHVPARVEPPPTPAGRVPFNATGTVPFNATGNVPFNATGNVPFNATGNVPFDATGSPASGGTGAAPTRGAGAPPLEGGRRHDRPGRGQ
jgi:uncharacterized protein DUF4124